MPELEKVKLKKVIAREGLVLLACIFIPLLTIFLYGLIPFAEKNNGIIFGILFLAIYFTYPVCLIIRFIFWSIKTLKEK